MSSSVEPPAFQAFLPGQLSGGIVVNVFAVLAAIALLSVAIRVSWLAITALFTTEDTWTAPREYTFFHTTIGMYAACLLMADLASAVAGLLGLFWVVQRGITPGLLCTIQAVLMQFANSSSAYFHVVLGVHTLFSLVLRWKANKAVAWGVIVFGWTFGICVAVVPLFVQAEFGPIYGPAGLVCGVRNTYPSRQFIQHLLPIFVAATLSALINSAVFLVLRGTLVINGGLKINLDPQARWSQNFMNEEYSAFVSAISKSMLCFPIAYIALLVPYAVTRMLAVSRLVDVPFPAIVFAYVCWYLLGIVNVALLYNTFRILVPAIAVQTTRKDFESFGTPEAYSRFSRLPFPKEKSDLESTSMTTEKIAQYRSFSTHNTIAHQKSFSSLSNGSTTSIRPLILSTSPSTPYVPRTISRTSILNRNVNSPEVVARPLVAELSSRRWSQESVGLKAAPRPPRTAVHNPRVDSISSETERYMISVRPGTPPTGFAILEDNEHPNGLTVPRGRGVSIASVNSSTLDDMADWRLQYSADIVLPRKPEPIPISAVATRQTFSSSTYFDAYPRRESSFSTTPSQTLIGPVPSQRRRDSPP